jgi:hypothetical protein
MLMAHEIESQGRWEGGGTGGSSMKVRGQCNTYTSLFEDQLSP